jgi:hypothetical protein
MVKAVVTSDEKSIAARHAAEKALGLYCNYIDSRTLEALSEVFTVDCRVWFGSDQIEGLDSLLDYLRHGLARFSTTRHVVSDFEIKRGGDEKADLDPTRTDRQRVNSRVVAWHELANGRPSLTLFGRYEDLMVETPHGWRIAEHIGSEIRRERGIAAPRSAFD